MRVGAAKDLMADGVGIAADHAGRWLEIDEHHCTVCRTRRDHYLRTNPKFSAYRFDQSLTSVGSMKRCDQVSTTMALDGNRAVAPRRPVGHVQMLAPFRQAHQPRGEMSDAFAEGSSSAKAQHIGQAIDPS